MSTSFRSWRVLVASALACTSLLLAAMSSGAPTQAAGVDVGSSSTIRPSADASASAGASRVATDELTSINVVDLGTLGGLTSSPVALNQAGQVAGYSRTAANLQHGFFWSPVDGVMRDLGTLGGSEVWVNGMNDDGLVVGYSNTASPQSHPFVWDPATSVMTDLGPLLPGASSYAKAINNAEQVAGDGPGGAWLWSPGTGMVGLGSLNPAQPGLTFVSDLNEVGQVGGYGRTSSSSSASDGFVWTAGEGIQTFGSAGYDTRLYDLNDLGQALAEQYPCQNTSCTEIDIAHTRVVRWSPSDGLVVLSVPGGATPRIDVWPDNLNNHGHAVGHIDTWVGGVCCDQMSGFRWTPEDGLLALLSPPGGYAESSAFAINDQELVVGRSGPRATLWSPILEPIDLGPGWTFLLNDHGQAAGLGNNLHATLWQLPELIDDDGDGIVDFNDNCPGAANHDQADNDFDGAGDACDADDDNDGVADVDDAFPFDPNESADADNDGIGDNADTDDDNDGQGDAVELACGSDPHDADDRSPDSDDDGVPDCADHNIVDLGTLGGQNSWPSDVNAGGQIVGYSETGMTNEFGWPQYHPFLWTLEGGMTDLGTFGGPSGYATDINNLGQIVGYSDLPQTEETSAPEQRPFLWTAEDGTIDLGDLGEPWQNLSLIRINDAGQVSGYGATADGASHVFVWTATDGMQEVGPLDAEHPQAFMYALNEVGQIGGASQVDDNYHVHAFIGSASAGLTDLHAAGLSSFAFDLNESGQVVGGVSYLDPYCDETTCHFDERAALWTEADGMTDLGRLGGEYSAAIDINNQGQVVGYSQLTDGQAGFLWTPEDGMRDIGHLGTGPLTTYTGAYRINEHGQVVGASLTNYGAFHAFVWTAVQGMTDLGTLPLGNYSDALFLNDSGLVVGNGNAAEGANHVVAWQLPPLPPDTDGDGLTDDVDTDDDNDGQSDADELACGSDPLSDTSKATDTDGDGAPDCVDVDDDNDGVADDGDNCPLVVNNDQGNHDADGEGDACDADDDNDGVADSSDPFPLSDQQANLHVGSCASTIANHALADGSTFNDLIGHCVAQATNHGQMVSCVTGLANGWKLSGLITNPVKAQIIQLAAQCTAP